LKSKKILETEEIYKYVDYSFITKFISQKF
jgi:hypothetical protein